MVDYKLDAVFASLSDPTRRDILKRVARRELSVSEIAKAYEREMSLAAVSKHVAVLERAKLVRKRRAGKQQFISLSPPALSVAEKYLEQYREIWERRLDRLEKYIAENP